MNEVRPENAPVQPAGGLGTSGRVALAGFAVVAAYFLWTEHRAHVIQYLPWGLVALCPLMHIFMHRGHGAHDPGRESEPGGRDT